jgi:hypothetical protein
MSRLYLSAGLALALAACGDDAAAPDAGPDPIDAPATPDAAPGPDANLEMPATLTETGLCVDAACTAISADVHEFRPRYGLWTDGAAKRRWIQLPEGATIDTSDMDYWEFPVGTKLWKEFVRDDVRVETRLLQKNGPEPDDWYMVAFAWNEAQTEAVAEPFGASNVLGTEHDIPGRSDCRKCHDRLQSRVLGFGALQLDEATDDGLYDLADLIADGALSDPPAAPTADTHAFPLPGDATAQAALGYLHANCGSCHNPTTDIASGPTIDLRLRVGLLATVEVTPTYTTTVDVEPALALAGATALIEPGAPSTSAIFMRMESDNDAQKMPPIGRELPDGTGLAALSAWITSLQP